MRKVDNERKELFDREDFSSQEEMVSLNEAINQDFFVEQLESRLETDPLMAGGLFDLFTVEENSGCFCFIRNYCGEQTILSK